MKRVGFIYEKIIDKEYIKNIIILASKHKTKRKGVIKVLNDIDNYVDKIQKMIMDDNIVLKPTIHRTITVANKTREITISPFYPNQILDYLLTETVKPIIMKSFYIYSIGNIVGKGISYGKRVIEKKIRHYKYFVKLDIHHFYPSIPNELLIKKLATKIKDKKFLDFSRKILCEQGFPIGSYYSQLLSNFYLTDMDHYIKETLKVPLLVRYVDDMLLVGNNKKQLQNAVYEIKRELEKNGLILKRVEIVKKIDKLHPISFLGFNFYKTHTYLRNKLFRSLKRTVQKLKQHICDSLIKRIIAYLGWLKQIKTGYNYYMKYIKPIIKIGFVRYRASLLG